MLDRQEGQQDELHVERVLQDARAVLADVANYTNEAIYEAARHIAVHGETFRERKRCSDLARVLKPLVST